MHIVIECGREALKVAVSNRFSDLERRILVFAKQPVEICIAVQRMIMYQAYAHNMQTKGS